MLAARCISFWVNWVFTQPDYPQLRTCKNNCVFFIFFTPHFFSVITHLFLLNEAIGNAPAYLLTPIVAFLEYQTSGFYYTWSKSRPLVDIYRWHTLCKVTHSYCFPRILDWVPIFLLIKLELYLHALVKNHYPTGICYYPNGNERDHMVHNYIACYCIPTVGIGFLYAHI